MVVTLLALAMLSLSTVTQRSVSHGEAQAEARANARLALSIALGELQKHMGPDQRVSAEANLDESVGSGKAHWVGAWSSEDAEENGQPDGDFLTWFVSRPESDPLADYAEISGDVPASSEDWVQMVGVGSVEDDPDMDVFVPRVEIASDTGDLKGYYGWWVSDEGVKARVDLQNTQEENRLAARGMQRAAVEMMDSLQGVDPEDADMEKLVSKKSSEQLGGLDEDLLKQHFHNLTVNSVGIMTNNLYGGLKTDLSTLFEKRDTDFEAEDIENYTPFVYSDAPFGSSGASSRDLGLLYIEDGQDNKFDELGSGGISPSDEGYLYGPTIDILRDYYRLYRDVSTKNTRPTLDARANYPNKAEMGMWYRTPATYAWRWGGPQQDPHANKKVEFEGWWVHGNSRTVDVVRPTKANYVPYMNRVMLYMSAYSVPDNLGDGDDDEEETFTIYGRILPVVFLHNPYNVRLETEEMRFIKNIGNLEVLLRFDSQGQNEEVRYANVISRDGQTDSITSGGGQGDAQFIIPSGQQFQPGEVKVFVPTAGQSWGSVMNMEPMGSGFDPNEMGINIDVDYDAYTGANDASPMREIPAETSVQIFFHWDNYAQQDLELYSRDRGGYNTVYSAFCRGLRTATTGEFQGKGQSAILRASPSYLIDGDLLSPTPINVLDYYIKPVTSYDDVSGAGFPAFLLNNPMAASDSNVEYRPSQGIDLMPGSGAQSPMVNYHYDYAEMGFPRLMDSFTGDSGTWGDGHGSAGQKTAVVMEIPTAPLQGLGGLQHANVSIEGNNPAFLIGSSFPNLQISNTSELIETKSASGRSRVHFDSAYFANQALWDRYFFSSIAPRPTDNVYNNANGNADSVIKEVITEFVEQSEPLANTRMTLMQSSLSAEEVIADLEDYTLAAAHLGVKGAFNINSTSEEAWRAVLTGFRGQDFDTYNSTISSESNSNVNPMPKLTLANSGGTTSASASSADAWAGYRNLTDQQIEALAKQIVDQIRGRAEDRAKELGRSGEVVPNLTIGQFVNRIPTSSNNFYRNSGTIQQAINATAINNSLDRDGSFTVSDFNSLPNHEPYPSNNNFSVPIAGSSTLFVTQGDVLQAMGSTVTARSDTFTIRAYGDAVDSSGKIIAQAWCEAVVQRTPEPVNPDPDNRWESIDQGEEGDFGRKFEVRSFRWLNKNEI